ncbi:hypothetical protein C0J52_14593 [Blattella germanica]|nr:hypothetical protein C0J52_14593 [Blattella germanica]PSN52627.1 hypothetical protein C0J52_14593 [Blattella germanica]
MGIHKSYCLLNTSKTVNELTERIFAAFDTLREKRGIFQRIRQNMVRRCTLCNEIGGRHFEHLL